MKVDLKARQESLERTEFELRQEKAAALGRIGKALEESIGRLHSLRECADGLSGVKRNAVIEEYREARKRAQLYYWYLLVQREAIGLRNHSDVFGLFRIPPPCFDI